jgi:hypothetical protein
MKSSFRACPQHETFEELAALAVVGELSPLELQRLLQHVDECVPCREAYEAFAEVSMNDLGVAVAVVESGEAGAVGDGDVSDARQQLLRLRNRIKAEPLVGFSSLKSATAESFKKVSARRHGYRRLAYGLAATVLLSVAVGGTIAFWRTAKMASAERARSRELQSVVDSLKQVKTNDTTGSDTAVLRSLQESQKARDVLQKYLAASEAKNGQLLARERTAQEKLAGAIGAAEQLRAQLEAKDADRERLAKLQQESDAKLHEALVELYHARQAPVQILAKSEAHDDANVASKSQPGSENGATFSPSEVEARNLFGARDLHIVDVYDVTGDGKTKRTYGRVYYVEKKLLVFYAFDLENRQLHKKGSFQAWGYREANLGKPQSLGLFTIDDTPTNRWVLTVNRPDVLSHIDAVFVTVEPPGGNTAPRGKKVLYANLVGPPNHP